MSTSIYIYIYDIYNKYIYTVETGIYKHIFEIDV